MNNGHFIEFYVLTKASPSGFVQSIKVNQKKVFFRLFRENHGKSGYVLKSYRKFLKGQRNVSVSLQLLLNV